MKHPATFSVDRLLADCVVERTRRGGPGGQHRNKVETAVAITHLPTGVRAEASERRSQAANYARAVFRLRLRLALRVRCVAAEAPSPLWTGRVSGRAIRVSAEHDDFPALLAEALDVLAAQGWVVAESAELLGVTASQLVKLLKVEGDALALLNQRRQALGLPPCR